MASSDELEYLKGLVAQLNEKIRVLEGRAKPVAQGPKTPAQQLRTILIGPPGAGTCSLFFHSLNVWRFRRNADALFVPL